MTTIAYENYMARIHSKTSIGGIEVSHGDAHTRMPMMEVISDRVPPMSDQLVQAIDRGIDEHKKLEEQRELERALVVIESERYR
jgi:nitrate/TMAO reductase-like tetraheme cytochrome c subunit